MPSRLALGTIALVAVALAACGPKKVTPEQREQIHSILDGLRTRGATADAARRKAIAGVRGLAPRPDLGPCPLKIPVPKDLTRHRTLTNFMNDEAMMKLEMAPLKGKAPDEQGPAWYYLKGKIESYERAIGREPVEGYGDDPGTSILIQSQRIPDPSTWDYDFYLSLDEYAEPEIQVDGYIPGQLRGRLFVWSYTSSEIICAADATSTSSESVGTTSFGDVPNPADAQTVLALDLKYEALRSALSHLSKAGPRKGP